jgi:predicted DsbA family dithiol-disulfide isomerase
MSEKAVAALRIEIWSDVICPWCYIGKTRFDQAVERLGDEIDLEVTYRAYQLDPTARPGVTEPVAEAYSRKFGGPDQAHQVISRVTSAAAEDGIDMRLDRALRANTLLAHRLLWWASTPECPASQAAVQDRLMRAYFTDSDDIGDPERLAELLSDLGVDPAATTDFLAGDAGVAEVAGEIERAGEHGISAVPTFVVNGQWAIPGAQDVETFERVLRRLAERQ